MDYSNIISWSGLSVKLTGKTTNITKTRIPKKYLYKIGLLQKKIEEWEKEIREIENLEK